MRKAFMDEWRLRGRGIISYLGSVAGSFLFGQLLLLLIMRLSRDPGELIPLGAIMAAVGCFLAAVIGDGFGFGSDFQLALSMGRARRPLIAAHLVMSLLRLLAGMAVVGLLACLEQALSSRLYPGVTVGFSFLSLLRWWSVGLFAAGTLLIALLCAGVHGKYGARGGAVLYIILVACCVGLPRLADAAEKSPGGSVARLWYGLGAFLAPVPAAAWAALGALGALALAAASLRMLMTLRVNAV